MKNLTLFVLCLVAGIAWGQDMRPASGGTARNVAMGGGPLNPYLVDVMRVHTNPALLNNYGNYVWGDLGFVNQDAGGGNANFGGGTFQYAAGAFEFSREFKAGFIVNRRESPLYTVDAADPSRDPITQFNTGAPGVGRPLSPVEVLASYSLMSSLDVGLAITIAGWSTKDDDGTRIIEQSSRVTGFKLGGNYDLTGGSIVDAALLFRINNMNYKNSATGATPSEVKTKGGIEMGLDARVIWKIDDRWSLLPVGRFSSFGWGAELTPAPAAPSSNPPLEFNHTEFEFGVGANYKTEKLLLAGGLSFQSLSSKQEDKSAAQTVKTTVTQTDLPKINWGVEFSATDWLVIRGGYFKRLSSTETKVEAATTTTVTTSGEFPYYGDPNGLSAAQQAFTLGAGLHFSGFSFDGTLAEGYFITGPWPLSGIGQVLFGIVSLHYLW